MNIETKPETRGRSQADSRKERVPLGVPASRLTIPESEKDPNYVYRIVNDDDAGRIQRAIAGGYEFVKDPLKLGSGTQDANTDIGNAVSRVVGTKADGKPLRGYVMRIRKDWYLADQAEKQRPLDEFERTIRKGLPPITGQDQEHSYTTGTSVKTALRSKVA